MSELQIGLWGIAFLFLLLDDLRQLVASSTVLG